MKSMAQISRNPITKLDSIKLAAEKTPIEKEASLMNLGSSANIVNAVRPSAGTILGAGVMAAGVKAAGSTLLAHDASRTLATK